MMIKTKEDAADILRNAIKAYDNDWSKVESMIPSFAAASVDNTLSELLFWYCSEAERVDYIGRAADQGFKGNGLQILQKGQAIFAGDILREAYEDIVQESEDQRVSNAQEESS